MCGYNRHVKDLTREERAWLEAMHEVFEKGGYERSKLVETLRNMVEAARRALVEKLTSPTR
jgi:hypothetical protein